ncbi:hypothetical protein HNP73_004069 [Amaricoccus macauensis]|uniref:Excalibur calcium-binding domain-containing protein n=1 Tax=Amaricoccus macauensis TaxID=57001 RepID=A0A840STW7_9RHOB|nr:excalibur calcium-binding domain-containing protein [Amaricoccus macauensis]MBB5224108.1 hypothetical protein [Amaricoccus macauensis]
MRGWCRLLPAALVCACATPGPPPEFARNAALAQAYASQSTEELWRRQATTSGPLELLIVEAELANRGEWQSGTNYIGSRSSASVGSSRYVRSAAETGDRDCADFPTAAAAQRHFLATGGPVYDRDGLDRDGDGFACEWGVEAKANRDRYAAPVRSSHALLSTPGTWSASQEYHLGPRGGCFYFTSAGNKQYVDRDLCY